MGGGLESRCVGRVCGADVAITLLHQVGISNYFIGGILFLPLSCLRSRSLWRCRTNGQLPVVQ